MAFCRLSLAVAASTIRGFAAAKICRCGVPFFSFLFSFRAANVHFVAATSLLQNPAKNRRQFRGDGINFIAFGKTASRLCNNEYLKLRKSRLNLDSGAAGHFCN